MLKFCLMIVLMLSMFIGVATADPVRILSITPEPAADWSGFGNIEVRVVKPFIPATLDFAGGISLQLTTLPAVLGTRKIFVDALASTENGNSGYVGGSVSLKSAYDDDGLRIGVQITGPNLGKTWYLAKAFSFDW